MDALSLIPAPLLAAYREEFLRFAQEGAEAHHPGHSIVFYGSSSIRLWADLKGHFPDLPVVNRGFGGCTMAECAALFDHLVVPLRPKQLVLYAGDNDLANGAKPPDVAGHTASLLRKRHAALPQMAVLLLSIKPSPSRVHLMQYIQKTNVLLEQLARESPGCEFVDVFSRMLRQDGRPRLDLFMNDWLHLNENGYDLWRQILRPKLLNGAPPE